MSVRILTFSTLYPNSVDPSHGIFVETRLRHLLASGRVEGRVVAPVPWFPIKHRAFAKYGRYARVPAREVLNGIELSHPRYALLPKIGMSLAPFTLAAASLACISNLRRSGFEFDLIDAHYYYPDGVAAALIARYLKKPLVITGRGTDLNLIPRYQFPRKLIQWASRQAARSITVSAALKEALASLGVDRADIAVLRNGVDLHRFVPVEQSLARKALELDEGLILVSVGHLVERKGHALVIKALTRLPDAKLVIVGDGELRRELEQLSRSLGLDARVKFAGAIPQERLKYYFSAADALILASSREGWPNVLLESMACGTPVVATRVWGSPEVVGAPEAGVLIDARDEQSIAKGVKRLLAAYPEREATRRYSERFSWDETTFGQLRLFDAILARRDDLCAA